LQSAHLARLQADLAGIADVRLVSITVDPDHDSPRVLSAYAARFHADPHRWLFLTGPRDAIYRLAVDGFHLAAVSSRQRQAAPTPWVWLGPSRAWAHEEQASPRIITLVHSSRFALVDRQGRIRGYFAGLDWVDVERLGRQLKGLLGEH
jgi:protein SCO1/2